MGATNFATVAHGKTIAEAFNDARERAAWEHGHGGYTGTIAEKGSYVLVDLPARWTAERFEEAVVAHADALRSVAYETDRVKHGWPKPPRHTLTPEMRQWRARQKRAAAALVHAVGTARAAEYVRIWDDKWGDCLAVPVSASERRAHLEYVTKTCARVRYSDGREEIVGKPARTTGVWRFFGMASC